MKIEKMSKIILEQGRLIRKLPVLRQWTYKRKDLIVKPEFYFIFLFTIKTLFPLLIRTRFALFIYLRIIYTFTIRNSLLSLQVFFFYK